VGQIGSGVRLSVSFQQKYPPGSVPRCPTAAENGVVSGGFDLRFRQQQTTDAAVSARLDACRHSLRLYFSHVATRTVDNTVDLYAAKPDIRPESRFLLILPAFDAPVMGGSRWNIAIPFGMEKLEWLGYPMVKIF